MGSTPQTSSHVVRRALWTVGYDLSDDATSAFPYDEVHLNGIMDQCVIKLYMDI